MTFHRVDGQQELTTLASAVDAASDPLERLRGLRLLTEAATAATITAVGSARAGRCTWEQVGAALNLSKQGAQQRYSRRLAQSAEPPQSPDPKPDPRPRQRALRGDRRGARGFRVKWSVLLQVWRW